MDRDGLADFLRRRRASIAPGDVGLTTGVRRRTPGLRREEVASSAHISTTFYTRLEQGRGSRPSEQTTASMATALGLTAEERDHLFALAGHTPPRTARRSHRPSAALVTLLAHVGAPAQIVSDLGVTLAQNDLARSLVGVQTHYDGRRRSIVHRWFTDPLQRRIHPREDHVGLSVGHVAALRLAHDARGGDAEASEMVQHLLGRSEEFADLWRRHEVLTVRNTDKRFLHPGFGEMAFHCHVLHGDNAAEHLVVFTPVADPDPRDVLAFLSRASSDVPEPELLAALP